MTSASARLALLPSIRRARWQAPVALLLGLAAVVGARWWATTAGADALWVGAAFGLCFAGLAVVGGRPATTGGRSRRSWLVRQSKVIVVGAAFGLVLVAVASIGSSLAGYPLVPGSSRPAAPFVPWAAITILVAGAEEALLRGRLFDAVRRAGGIVPAVLVTTLAFALMHVPLYGWHVVPLDLAVGFGFAGLRLATGGVAAPAIAHTVADLATWWL